MTGTVEELTLRVTKLRTASGEFVVVPNSALRQVTNLSKDWSRVVLDIPVAATEDLDRATSVLLEAANSMGEDPAWSGMLLGEPVVAGVETIEVGYVRLRLLVRTLPGRQFDVSRELRLRCSNRLRQAGIVTAPLPDDPASRASDRQGLERPRPADRWPRRGAVVDRAHGRGLRRARVVVPPGAHRSDHQQDHRAGQRGHHHHDGTGDDRDRRSPVDDHDLAVRGPHRHRSRRVVVDQQLLDQHHRPRGRRTTSSTVASAAGSTTTTLADQVEPISPSRSARGAAQVECSSTTARISSP